MTYWSHGNKIFLGSFSSSFASEKRLLWTKQTRLYELTEVEVLYNFQLGKHALSAKNCHRIFLLYFSFQVIFLFKFYINITIIIMLITDHLSWGLNIIQSNIILFVCLLLNVCFFISSPCILPGLITSASYIGSHDFFCHANRDLKKCPSNTKYNSIGSVHAFTLRLQHC